jgi:hypothetical protein
MEAVPDVVVVEVVVVVVVVVVWVTSPVTARLKLPELSR